MNNRIKGKNKEVVLTSVLFLMPAAFFLIVFIFYPIVNSFILSLHNWNGIDPIKTFIGFDNWKTLMVDARFWKSFSNNIVILVLSISIQIPVAMLLAVMMDYVGRRISFMRSVYFLPMLMSSVAIGFLFRYVYDPQFGLITGFFKLFGHDKLIDILGNPSYSMFAVIAVICWQFIPFYFVLFVAAISSLPTELFEASKIDGSSYKQYIWNIAIPVMSGSIKSAIILSMVGSLKYFDLIYVMTEGGPNGSTELMATYMYKNSFLSLKLGYGATVAFAMLLIISTISLFTVKLMNTKNREDLN